MEFPIKIMPFGDSITSSLNPYSSYRCYLDHMLKAAGIDRQALIIVGDVLRARREGLAAVSKLYDKEFSHGSRKGILT